MQGYDTGKTGPIPCKRCLLEELDPEGLMRDIRERIDLLPPEERASGEEYRRRLEECTRCSKLNAGTCIACGCFVELRAARAAMHCPMGDRW